MTLEETVVGGAGGWHLVEVASSDGQKIQVKSIISDPQVTADTGGWGQDGDKPGAVQPVSLGYVGMASLPDCQPLSFFRPLVSEAQPPFRQMGQ